MPDTSTPVPTYYPFVQEGYLYTWRLVYDDSSELREFNPDGSINKFEPSRRVVRVYWDAVDPLYRDLFVDVPEGAKPIVFRRHVRPSSGDEKYTCYSFGFETRNEAGETEKHIHHFTPAFETRLTYRGKLVTVRFPGTAEFTQDPAFEVGVDRWRCALYARLERELGEEPS